MYSRNNYSFDKFESLYGKLKLLEHEKSKWLAADELESVEWLPADVSILGKIRKLLK